MKRFLCFLILLLPAALPAAPPGVPAGARRIAPGEWRYTDPQGKTWIYRSGAFGVVRGEEQAASEQVPPGMKAVADGDRVRFERPSPFGPLCWVKKKSELSDLERRVWERDRATARPKESK